MKHPTVYKLSSLAAVLAAFITTSLARPIEFNEISLLIRAHEGEASIKNEVAQRKLMHALTPQQESKLKSEGASDSLVQSLRNPNFVISKDEAAAFAAPQTQKSKARATENPSSTAEGRLYVFDVALGHPINLSQWGGLDYELAFYSYRCAGEDIVEPVMIDNVRTGRLFHETSPLPGSAKMNGLGRITVSRAIGIGGSDSCPMITTAIDSRLTIRGAT